MERDESGTLATLKDRWKDVLEPLVARHRGRIFKVTGDGVLVEFGSAVKAVQCAIELQDAMAAANGDLPEARRIVLRIGVNLGDVMVEGSDLYGDGVNISARLEGLAEPGGVLVSGTVFDYVRNKLNAEFEDLGIHALKNIAEPVRLYRVAGTPRVSIETNRAIGRLSIAVLPFINISGDAEQEYFSDGVTEDVIIDLSKVSALSVVSRNSSFAFKGKAVDTSQIARQLKVGHVVEGSVRKAGERVRITAKLIDASNNSHIWAERYDRDLKDIFALQDEISQAIVMALKIKLLPNERKAIESRSTQNHKAYQAYLLARYYVTQYSARTEQVALRFCRRALEIDPEYARAWALAAICEALLYRDGRSQESGLTSAEKALSLDPTLAEAYAAKGRALCQLGRYDEAIAAHEVSLRLERDSYEVRCNFGVTCMFLGRLEEAIVHFERAVELRETDYLCAYLAASCYRTLGRHDQSRSAARRAVERAEREIALRADNSHAMVMGAIALAYLGEQERAKDWTSRALLIESADAQDHYNLACALAQMNEADQALDLLEDYARKMAPERINWIKRDVDLEPLRTNPATKRCSHNTRHDGRRLRQSKPVKTS
jgi:adenylate cyclase